ncbi:MAG: insulinase family protein [Planctomycetes bacterium]|nr:insulinase family protein [Planctomycetota bacterium]
MLSFSWPLRAAVLAACVCPEAVSQNKLFPYEFSIHDFDSGLRLITIPTDFPDVVSLHLIVSTGSRNEVEPGKSGFAHFFEHMMFRGTERFSPDAYNAVVTRAGARQNAYTTDDYTNYHITLAREDLPAILELEADRFMNLRYSEPDFRTEARAILGEYNKSASEPVTRLFEAQREKAYTVHTYQHTTMGFLRDIEAMPEQFEYSRMFFNRWYRPRYTTILIAGDVDPEATLALVRQHWSAWQPGTANAIVIPAEPEATGTAVVHVDWPSETLPWVTVGFHGPAFSSTESDFAALDLLFDLAFGETSELYQDLVEDRQLADQLVPWASGHQDPGLFTILARVKRPEDTVAVRDRILAAVRETRESLFETARLEDAKANARYSFAQTLDNSESIASTLARFVRYERRFETINELYRTYAALTPDDLQRVANQYLDGSRVVLATLSHDPLPTGIGDLTTAPTAALSVSATDAPGFPVIERPSPSALLRFKLLFRSGSAHDPKGNEGLAALSAAMVAEAGSERMRTEEISRALFPTAGAFRGRVDREMTTFTGVVHRDNIDRYLDVVLGQLLTPGYRDDDFARLKARQANELVQDLRSSNEEELGKERLQALLHRGTSYAHPSAGTEAGIATLDIESVRKWVAEHLTRGNLVFGLAGDWPEASKERLLRALGQLPGGAPTPAPAVTAHQPRGLAVEIIEKESRSVAISFGHSLAVTRSHPDFAALWLARSWLGEHRAQNGRLFQRLREVRGLNYGNYAYIEAFPRGMYQFFPDPNLGRQSQIFEVWIRPVPPEQAVFALKAAVYELRRLIEHGLTEDEFDETRAYLLKNVYLATKTQDQQLGYALDDHWYGIDDYVATMQRGLNALTAGDVNDAVRRHLSGTDLQAVMVARDAAALRDELLAASFTPIEYGSPKEQWVMDEDQEIGALDLGVNASSVVITPVSDVFQR